MAKCSICDKGAHFGIKVSHSHRRANKMWKSNVKSVKAVVDGAPKVIKEQLDKASAGGGSAYIHASKKVAEFVDTLEGDDSLFNCCSCSVKGILHTKLSLFHLCLCCSTGKRKTNHSAD